MAFKELMGKRIALKLDNPAPKELPKTSAGIITDVVAENKKPTTATIVAIGDEEIRKFKVGERVFIGEFYPAEIEIEGDKYVIVKPDDIIAKI